MTKQERLDRLYRTLYTGCGSLYVSAYPTDEPVPFDRKEDARGYGIRPGDRWGRNGSCAWLKLAGSVPAEKEGLDRVLLFDAGGEACLFDAGGNPLKGFTNVQSEFTVALGKPAKRVWNLPKDLPEGEVTFWADAGANDLFGCKPENGLFVQAEFAYCDPEKRNAYYDLEVLAYYADAVKSAEDEEWFWKASDLWAADPAEAGRMARERLRPDPEKTDGNTVFALGHAHIDLAWLWPVRETKRKTVRTLATVVSHMSRYPEYRFCVSQPQMLRWVREQQPGLYEEIRRLCREGRVEPVGGSWAEMDTNLPDGESLARQMIYGQRFWQEEFGMRPEMLWLPDTFGYSAQLPQLMKQAGMPHFLTTKLSWNSVNKFPYASFHWEGLDGTRVLAHIPPEGNYNSAARPDSVKKAESAPCSLLLFGIGDGGGGPGMEHLERLKREKDLAGMPHVRQAFARDLFRSLEAWEDKNEGRELPVWKGELYLEKHQGTYTTQSATKKNNRMCEKDLHQLEFLGACALRLAPGYRWEADRVRSIWERVLLHQFHDILPGSAIDRVYREADEAYAAIRSEITELTNKALNALEKAPETQAKNALLNSGPFENGTPCPETGMRVPQTAGLPYCFTEYDETGSRVSRPELRAAKTDGGAVLENGIVRVQIKGDGTIGSLMLKGCSEDFVRGAGNRLLVYPDLCDGWEVPDAYENGAPEQLLPENMSVGREGDTVYCTLQYRYRQSAVRQRIILRAGCARVECETDADWLEAHTLLRSETRSAVLSPYALCGVPFGELARPTLHRDSWEAAKREVCFQGYADLSDGERGLAVLSDCKYGLDVRDGRLSLALIRTPAFPAAHADRGHHTFTYALLPHTGGTENVRPEAFCMRNPAEIIECLPDLTEPFAEADGLIVSTVKPAEDGNGIIVRLYNPENRSGQTELHTAKSLGFTECRRTNLLEEDEGECPIGSLFTFRPYEILTFRLR